jgi:hypothetical protein
MYRYEIYCYSPSLGDFYTEKSGWYNDLIKCSNHCISRANSKKLRQSVEENGCSYECLIAISVVFNDSSYKVIKTINDTFDPLGVNSYSF